MTDNVKAWPKGWKLVPAEPTPEMLYAMAECDGYQRGDRDHPMLTRWEDYWRMAVAASPVAATALPAKPILWVARAKCDSEHTIVGELSVEDISEEQFEMHDPEVWECIPLFAAPQVMDEREPVAWQARTRCMDDGDRWSSWENISAPNVPTLRKWARESPSLYELRALYTAPPADLLRQALDALDDLINWMPRVEPAQGQQPLVDASIEKACAVLADLRLHLPCLRNKAKEPK